MTKRLLAERRCSVAAPQSSCQASYELVRRLLERKVKFAVLRPARDQMHDRGERGDIRLGGRYAGFNAGAQRNGVMGGARERRVLRVDERDHERTRVPGRSGGSEQVRAGA